VTTYDIYCGGEFLKTGKELKVINPYTDEHFASTYLADELLLDRAINKAQDAQEELKKLPSYKRAEILHYIAASLKQNRQYLAEVLCNESAKPIRYALGEIDRAAQTFLIAAEECKRLPKEYVSMDWTPVGTNREGLVKYFPIGLVAGISPFNFPMNLAVHKIAPAIAAGCPIILKPASSTPLSTLELAKIIDRTPLPKGSVSVLPMNRETGNLLVTDERFKLLSFTGSPEVGWKMKTQSGKKKVVLELGGNAGVIVTDSANFVDAINKSLAGAFAYSGQICIHAQRFFVHEHIFDLFLKEMVERTKLLSFGNPLKQETDVSDMIDEDNAMRVNSWISEAVNAGAKLLCGGKRTGSYVEPTILTNCTNKMKVYSEEVFGPVICIEKYNGTIEDAVAKMNDTKFGLQCGVFTNKINELDHCFNTIEVGGVIHNDVPTLRFDHMPYGGVKESGLGREGVKYAIMDMLEARVLVK
jgi:acyl-CoA reductase-like NAD-dependent aldehyde dehydrogenase